MFVTRTWYAAGYAHELGSQPIGRRICGQPVALFRDGAGKPHAVGAVCPHRGADLAQGRTIDNALECPFHGFRFDGAGRCTLVPSQSADKPISPRLKVPSYPIEERQGMLWIWPDADGAPDGEPPRYPFFEPAAGMRRYYCKTELYPASYVNTLENALDGGHLAFVHTGSVPGAAPLISDFKINMREDGKGYRGEDQSFTDPKSAAAQRRRMKLSSTGAGMWSGFLRSFFSRFLELAPTVKSGFIYDINGMVCFDSAYENGKEDYVLALITPADETHTWFFAQHVRSRGLNPVGDWITKRFMNILVGEDRDALDRYMMPEARGVGGLPNPAIVKADRTSFTFRHVYGGALKREGKPIPWIVDDDEASGRPGDVRAA